MHFRPASTEDAPTLSAIAHAAKAHWQYSHAQIEAWREELTVSPDMIAANRVYVAQVGEVIAGFFVLTPAARQWTLGHFWVPPSHMGCGIGRAMFSYASGIAAQGGAIELLIHADPNAERFYTACGAMRVGDVDAPIPGQPGRKLPTLIFRVR